MVSRPAGAVSADSFASPMTDKGHLPLRVAVYDKIAQAIRTSILLPSQLLPPEAELGIAFRVSRTVMREALILLEEDGLIRTQRGIGRFIVDELPTVGIEQLRPIEEILSIPGRSVAIRRTIENREAMTDFTRRGLGLDEGTEALMWESVVEGDGVALALAQEWVRTDAVGDPGTPGVLELLASGETTGVSMLEALARSLEDKLSAGVCEISVSNAGPRRAQMLGLTDGSPVLLLTQAVFYRNSPLMVAKYIIRTEGTHLTVAQS